MDQTSKRLRYLREIGMPSRVTEQEHEEVKRHIQKLHHQGMSTIAMSRASGKSWTTIADLVRGQRNYSSETGYRVLRSTYDALMPLTFEEFPSRGGARVDPTGTFRRMQALYRVGFGSAFLGECMGWHHDVQARKFMLGKAKFVFASTRQQMIEVYDKYEMVNPLDVGLNRRQVGKAIGTAKRGNYAPPSCWDPDTIDDPDAFPEWTGMCGTKAGYFLHYRHKIMPVCEPCKTGRAAEGRNAQHQSAEELHAHIRDLAEAGVSRDDIAREVERSRRTIDRVLDANQGDSHTGGSSDSVS